MIVHGDTPSENAVRIRLAEPGEDRELKVIAWIASVLADFDDDAKRRILAYLTARVRPPSAAA